MNDDLKKELANVKITVERELYGFFQSKIGLAKTTDSLHEDMVSVLSEYMMRGGKRIRPFLVWCGYNLSKKSNKEHGNVFRAGAAVETLHSYILNLDDMADRDELRHGGPTLEVFYRQHLQKSVPKSQELHYARSFSEIAGALLNTYAYELLRSSEFPPQRIVETLELFNRVMFELTSVGWQIHMLQNFEPLSLATEERFVKGLRYVTAQYTFVGPLLIGATLAGTAKELQNLITEYGMNVGTAFQIQDDILGLFGDPTITGKAVGNDVREGKKTLLIQYAYAHSTPTERLFLENIVGKELSEKDLAKVQEIVKKTGSLDASKHKALELIQSGIQALNSQSLDEHTQTLLQELAQYIIERNL